MGSLAVVILAAGQGKRMYSQTPKVLHPLLGEPMLGHVLATAAALQPDRLVVVCGHGRAEVEPYVAAWGVRHAAQLPEGVQPLCLEQPSQGGTGHAVRCAQPGWQGADEVLILYGDVPLLTAPTLQGLRAARGDRPLSLLAAELADPTGYGRVLRDASGHIAAVVEHKDASSEQRAVRLINAGMMCVDADFLADALPRLRPDNAQGELYLTDLLAMATAAGRAGVPHVLADHREALGVNNRAELAEASGLLRARLARSWMLQGVTLDDPATTTIETTVQLQPDVHLGGGVELRGQTRIASGARIDRGCVLTDTVVAEGAHMLPYTIASEAVVGRDVHVGPFAHLRPGTVLEERAKVGNFVETKKARLGAGSKASHLSYLGDADIGPDCNIGAGTITCNYDGVSKFKTTLGRGVFIGSDTQLVAPVTLGDDVYVGAGSTITADVPAGALALSRSPQQIREGWVAAKRARQPAKRGH